MGGNDERGRTTPIGKNAGDEKAGDEKVGEGKKAYFCGSDRTFNEEIHMNENEKPHEESNQAGMITMSNSVNKKTINDEDDNTSEEKKTEIETERTLSREEVESRLKSAGWTFEQMDDFINGPDLMKMLEAHPRFSEELSRNFFKKYPELLTEFVSEEDLPIQAGRYLPQNWEESRSPYFEWNSATDVSESKSEIAQRHIKKINENAYDLSSISRAVYLFRAVIKHMFMIMAFDHVILYLPTDDKKFIYEIILCPDRRITLKNEIKEFKPIEARRGTTVAAYVAATAHPVLIDKFSCGSVACQNPSYYCTCKSFPKQPKRSSSIMCQVMTDCDHNLLAVYELHRWRDGGLTPFTQMDSIKFLHVLMWGGITIGAAIEHQKLKDEQEMKNALVSFEEELLQQMNLLWYQIGKLKKVVQKLVPRTSDVWVFLISDDDEVMRVKTEDDDREFTCGADRSSKTNLTTAETGTNRNCISIPNILSVSSVPSKTTWGAVSQHGVEVVDRFMLPLMPNFKSEGYLVEDFNVPSSKQKGQNVNKNSCEDDESQDNPETEIGAFYFKTANNSNDATKNDEAGYSNTPLETTPKISGMLNAARASFEEPPLKSWPVGTGISGAAAAQKKLFNITNVKEFKLYSEDIDNLKPNLNIRTQLSVPIFMELDFPDMVQPKDRVCAVITLVSDVQGLFPPREVDLIQRLANCCGHAFVQGQQFDKFHKAEVQRMVNMELHACHMEPTKKHLAELKECYKTLVPPADLEKFDFCGWNLERTQKVAFLIHMFNRLFETKFDYEIDVLAKFFLVVAINYRHDVAYHNFNHAFEVTQKIYVTLIGCCHGFTLLESVALFLAAICHDLDHRGLNNKFNNDQNTLMANLHQEATMEHHHFRMTLAILTHGKTNFLINWPSSRYQELLICIKHCILSTDVPTGRVHFAAGRFPHELSSLER